VSAQPGAAPQVKARLAPLAAVLRRRALQYGRDELRWLWQSGHAHWTPYAGVYELAKFVGLQLGARHGKLPTNVKRRLSASPAYWSG